MTYPEFVTLVGAAAGMSTPIGPDLPGEVAWRLLVKLRPDIADPIRMGRTSLPSDTPTVDQAAFWDVVRARWDRS